jgi:hypothetical protein
MNIVPNEGLMREQLLLSVSWVREQLRRADIGSNFTLTVKIEGPIQADGAKLTFSLDCSSNYDSSIKGNNLADVTWELLRRMGWTSKNSGLAITWNGEGAGAPSLEKEF